MVKMLGELWYGNISPFENTLRDNARIKELLNLAVRNSEKLRETLTQVQKETLEKYEDCMNEMSALSEKEIFEYGFRLGARIMVEVFYEIE
ncbi:MAG: hypothetical protein IIU77_06925 [Clostridia bacterium]|nr:hypothetical protein [Clostridia bacterium]